MFGCETTEDQHKKSMRGAEMDNLQCLVGIKNIDKTRCRDMYCKKIKSYSDESLRIV